MEAERHIDETAIRRGVERLVPHYVDLLDECLNLPQRSNNLWASEVVGHAPACLRRLELHLVSARKGGYVLMAEPVFWDGEMTRAEPYVGAVCGGLMGEVRDYLQRPGIVDELTRKYIVLAKLSLGAYGYQRWKEKWKGMVCRWRVRCARMAGRFGT